MDVFGPKDSDIESLYNILPHPKDLPIPGAQYLADLLKKDTPRFITTLRYRINGRAERYATISVREALEVLFGKTEQKSNGTEVHM